jgi:molybdopterin-containing oxidoreductase family membrane subunit
VLGSLGPPTFGYKLVLGICAFLALAGVVAFTLQVRIGMGVTGLSVPVGWAFYITNFVWWIGIAHSGTLISAILFLFRTKWRNGINRAAEAMTIFAIMTAGLFPLIHLGRIWVFYWILPYPNWRYLWPNFKSPLVWDVIAVTTYFTVSLLFFYLGLLPDLATARDNTKGRRHTMYRVLSLGWTGRYDQWRHYARGYLALAALATPLVISVHSVVSWDFAMSILPGWHTTIFAPYFVAGAIHQGLGMVMILFIPLRRVLHLERILVVPYFTAMAELMILTGSIVGYAYIVEAFMSWYSADIFERQFAVFRATGPIFGGLFWSMVVLNVAVPMTFFSKRLRSNLNWLFIAALLVNIGMWLERFVIIVSSTAHDFLPSSWGSYSPRIVEITITLGALGFFLFLVLSFVKLFPSVPMNEMKESILEKQEAKH